MLSRLILLIALLFPVYLSGQTNWQLVKNREGIKIYTSKSTNSNFKRVKASSVCQGTIDRAIRVFRNVAGQPNWVYSTKRACIIRQSTENDILYYVESALPWPLSNRYLLARMKIQPDLENKQVLIYTTADTSEQFSSGDGKIRITYFKVTWQIKQIDAKMISIEYFLDIDPGGNLPASVVNLFISQGPYKTLLKLAELLRK